MMIDMNSYICSDVNMTNVKHTLQKEIFLPTDERLLNVVNVTKPGKKKKASLLCIAGR